MMTYLFNTQHASANTSCFGLFSLERDDKRLISSSHAVDKETILSGRIQDLPHKQERFFIHTFFYLLNLLSKFFRIN